MKRHHFNIEIAGNCNLRCPSSPVGNSVADGRPRGFMDIALFEQVVRKTVAESKGARPKIALYDWGEPTLHPQLPEILDIIRRNGLQSRVSSKLNVDLRFDPTFKANPTSFTSRFRASTSAIIRPPTGADRSRRSSPTCGIFAS